MALREINLIPADILHKKYLFRHLFLWAGCLVICLCLIFGFYLYQVRVVLPKKRPVTTLEDMHKHLGTTIEEIKETQQEIQRLSLQESFLKNLTQTQPFSKIFLRVAKIMNTRTWLTKLTIAAGSEEEEFTSNIELHGYSLSNADVGNFLTQLSGEPIIESVVLKYAKETQIVRSPQERNAFVKVIDFHMDCKISKLYFCKSYAYNNIK
ncbi:MAG: PilN domain-containing protein [Desulfobacterales bacterium]|nr:MAG: PilN domain-containing protein [Desulfobacterales bacterium]